MPQNKRLRPTILFPALVLSLGAFGVPAGAAPLQTGAHDAKAAAKPPSGDGSLFGEVIPAEMEQSVTVKPSWLPLSKQLAALQDATAVPLTRAPSMPDDPLFVAAPGRTEFSLLHQMRLLLTDDQWQCQWANRDIGKDRRSYRLWREAVSPQERRARMAKAAKERLAKVLALLAAGPQAWDAAQRDDPDLSGGIRQPIRQAPLLLASELSPDQLDGILSGSPLTLPVAAMSPEDQARVRQSLSVHPSDSNPSITTVTNRLTGATRVIFDERHLPTTGEVVFETAALVGDPGSLELAMHVYTEPGHEEGEGSNGMLYMAIPDLAPEEKQQIEARHRQAAADALAAKTPGAKTVTIDKDAKPQEGEPPLAAYLRAFAEQTKLTVLAHWPSEGEALTDSQGQPKRLPAPIVDRPAGEALDILCKTYGGEWVQDETTVRLRALPAPEPLLTKPDATKTDATKTAPGFPAASAAPPVSVGGSPGR